MTPRSDPHTEAIREGLEILAPPHVTREYRSEDAAADKIRAASAALESERDEAVALGSRCIVAEQERAQILLDAKNHWADRAVAAEARVTQLEEALARAREILPCLTPIELGTGDLTCLATETDPDMMCEHCAVFALGVVADGGGGQ